MKAADQAVHARSDAAVFTVRLRGRVHRCALSDEALYLLSQQMAPGLDRIDAYLLLKRRVAAAAQAYMDEGASAPPALMEACHLMRRRF